MSKERKTRLKRYIITIAVGLLIAGGVMAARNFGGAATAVQRIVILCDAFTVPGVLLILAAGLVFVSNNGIFYGLGFALSRAVLFLFPGGMTTKKHERYGDYVERKREKGGIKDYRFLPIVGAAFLAVGVILTVVYYGAFG